MTDGNGQRGELPRGWTFGRHKDIAEINPKLPFDDLSDDVTVSFLPMAAVEERTGSFSLSETRQYRDVKKGYTPFTNGDIIFAKITPCMENGKIAVVKDLENEIGFGSTEFHVSRLNRFSNRKYFFYFLNQESFRRDARQRMTGSAGQLRVPKTYFEETTFPIPPLAEQARIVEKIEELFSDLDVGVESLKKAQRQLKIYRQAVLKWAFEGKLTADWREQQQQQGIRLKTGVELLADIKAEREKRYQQQLEEWESAIEQWEHEGRSGKKPGKPQEPKSFYPINDEGTVEIPRNWCCIYSGMLFTFVTSGSRGWARYYSDSGSIFIRITNLDFDSLKIDLAAEKIQYVFLPRDTEGTRTKIYENDFLFSITGYLGMFAIAPNNLSDAYVNQHIALARPLPNLNYKYFGYYFIAESGGLRQFQEKQKGATKAGLSLDDIQAVKIPLASLEEQEKVVEEIESRLSICDQLEAMIAENLQRAESLRQSILKRAFEGKLVPQDYSDEPAEKLLERIRQEKQQATAARTLKRTQSRTEKNAGKRTTKKTKANADVLEQLPIDGLGG